MKKEKGQKVKFIVYVVVRVLVVLALIRQIWEHDWHDVMLCGMTLILLFLPTLRTSRLAAAGRRSRPRPFSAVRCRMS